jgi:hypothetical protein
MVAPAQTLSKQTSWPTKGLREHANAVTATLPKRDSKNSYSILEHTSRSPRKQILAPDSVNRNGASGGSPVAWADSSTSGVSQPTGGSPQTTLTKKFDTSADGESPVCVETGLVDRHSAWKLVSAQGWLPKGLFPGRLLRIPVMGFGSSLVPQRHCQPGNWLRIERTLDD